MADIRTGIDELRTAVQALDNCREDFLASAREPFSAEQLLTIWRAWRKSEWDLYPDQWSARQVREALTGKVPRWDNEGKPFYDAPEYTVRAHDEAETIIVEHVSADKALDAHESAGGHATIYDDADDEPACMAALGMGACECHRCAK